MSSIKLTVTQDMIDRGNPASYCGCPLALAAHEALGGYVLGNGVTYERVSVGRKDYRHTIRSLRFLTNFDHYKPVKPSTFILQEIQ